MSWLPIEVTVAPTDEPLSVADATVHLKASAGDAEDQAYILGLTKAARAHVESYTGLKIMPQTVKMRRSEFCDGMALPVAPVSAVSLVEYLDMSGATQTLSTTIYQASLYGLAPIITRRWYKIWPLTYLSPEAVTVTATVGFTSVPDDLIHALKLLVAAWYDQRSGTSDKPILTVPHAVDALLSNYRVAAF